MISGRHDSAARKAAIAALVAAALLVSTSSSVRAQDALPARPVFHRALTDPALDVAVAGAALLFNYAVDP